MSQASINFYYETTNYVDDTYENALTIKVTERSGGKLQIKTSYTTLKYSLDNGMTWTDWPEQNYWLTVNYDDTISFVGHIAAGTSVFLNLKDNNLSNNISFTAYGNPLSVIYPDTYNNVTNISGTSSLLNSFFRGTSITDASKLILNATTLSNSCYVNMFRECTSLATAPELSATTLATNCYANMFSGCTSLTKSPNLPATTLDEGCYSAMFSGCTSLTEPPNLPATTLADHCYYYMFGGCTSLKYAPALPATTLANSCYHYMFTGCTSLATAPELPATTLAESCYKFMFKNCTFEKSPVLPATTLATDCYNNMFNGCAHLNQITLLADVVDIHTVNGEPYNPLLGWSTNVFPVGIFYKKHGLTNLPRGADGIPRNWEIRDYVNPDDIVYYNVTVTPSDYSKGYVEVYYNNNLNYSGTYLANETIQIVAHAYDGYVFDGYYTIEDEEETLVSSNYQYQLTVTENVQLICKFVADDTVYNTVGIKYNINTVSAVTGEGKYEYNTSVTVSTTLRSGYRIIGWKLNDVIVSTNLSYTFTITEDVNLYLETEPIPIYSVTVYNDYGDNLGIITLSQPDFSPNYYYEGTTLTVSIEEEGGSIKFTGWEINGVSYSNNRTITITINENLEITPLASYVSESIKYSQYFTIEALKDNVKVSFYCDTLLRDNNNEYISHFNSGTGMINMNFRLNNSGWQSTNYKLYNKRRYYDSSNTVNGARHSSFTLSNGNLCNPVLIELHEGDKLRICGDLSLAFTRWSDRWVQSHSNDTPVQWGLYDYGSSSNPGLNYESYTNIGIEVWREEPELEPGETLPSDYHDDYYFVYGNIDSLFAVNAYANTLNSSYLDNFLEHNFRIYTGPNRLAKLFMNQHGIRDAAGLVIPNYGYESEMSFMFYDSTIKYAPWIKFMNNTSYSNSEDTYDNVGEWGCAAMFKNCTRLKYVPRLTAPPTEKNCYESMFENCYAINHLIASGIDVNKIESWSTDIIAYRSCYKMFRNCTSLTSDIHFEYHTWNELVASIIKGASALAYMYEGCTSLRSSFVGVNNSLSTGYYESACEGMYKGCTSLEYFYINLNSYPPSDDVTLYNVNTCKDIFYGCTNLTQIFVVCNNIPKDSNGNYTMTENWLYGVAENGLFHLNASAIWDDRSVSAIPTTWDLQFD